MKNHESALLVVLAYIIGFTTAFIMFVLASDGKSKDINRVVESGSDLVLGDNAKVVELMQTSEGLFVKVDGKERIINARTDDTEAEPGFHIDLVAASVSPDGKYVHYCAEMALAADSCQNFVYSMLEDATYVVKSDDVPVKSPSAEAANSFWSDASMLHIGASTTGPGSRWTVR